MRAQVIDTMHVIPMVQGQVPKNRQAISAAFDGAFAYDGLVEDVLRWVRKSGLVGNRQDFFSPPGNGGRED